MHDTSGKMHSLVENAHLFSLASVHNEYNTHMTRLSPVFELDSNGAETTTESSVSIQAKTKEYNEYELYDIALSRLVVESPISSSYHKTIKTRFLASRKLRELPGQVYFVMVLDACNTSAAIDIDIDNVQLKFDELSL